MDCWQRILNYYLDSDQYFGNEVELFFEAFDHVGKCRAKNGEIVTYKTEAAYCTHKWLENTGGRYCLSLPEKEIQHYFTTQYSKDQLFCIIFAKWFELNKDQTQILKDRRKEKLCFIMLHCFLLGMTAKEASNFMKENASLSVDEKRRKLWEYWNECDVYFIRDGIAHKEHIMQKPIRLD